MLHGYNRTTTRVNARVLMQIDADNPLWVTQQVGMGQSAIWASDLGARWGRDWLQSDALAALVPALLAPLIPRAPQNLSFAWYAHDDLLDIDVTTDITTTVPVAQLVSADGTALPIPLTQRDAQHWRAIVADTPSGDYVLTVRTGDAVVTRGVVITQRSKFLNDGQGGATLSDIAQQTNGIRNPTVDRAYWQVRGGAQSASLSLVPYLVVMAMVLFVGEIAVRRLNIQLGATIWHRNRAAPTPRLRRYPRPVRRPHPRSRIERLHQAKRRASAPDDTNVSH
jgi:hypothetical protein